VGRKSQDPPLFIQYSGVLPDVNHRNPGLLVPGPRLVEGGVKVLRNIDLDIDVANRVWIPNRTCDWHAIETPLVAPNYMCGVWLPCVCRWIQTILQQRRQEYNERTIAQRGKCQMVTMALGANMWISLALGPIVQPSQPTTRILEGRIRMRQKNHCLELCKHLSKKYIEISAKYLFYSWRPYRPAQQIPIFSKG